MMAPPPVYLDECVDYNLADALRKRGFSVTTVFDEHTEGLDDERQLAYAASHGRCSSKALVASSSRAWARSARR